RQQGQDDGQGRRAQCHLRKPAENNRKAADPPAPDPGARVGVPCAVPMAPRAALLALALLPLPGTARAATRPLRIDDIYSLKDVADPQVSPDGAWIAYTVTSLSAKRDESNDDIWMSPAAGGEAVRLTSSLES